MATAVERKTKLPRTVPFFASPDWNTPHPTYCLPAVVKMVLEYYFPGFGYTWEAVEGMTHKLPGKWTMTTGTVLSLNGTGLTATQITDFDYLGFKTEGENYIRRRYKDRPKSAEAFIVNVDIPYEQGIVEGALRHNHRAFENRIPDVNDLIANINAPDSLVIAQFNARLLAGLDGYVGHFGLATAIDPKANTFTFHDPGGSTHPPEENRRVPLDLFIRAWAGEKGTDGTMIAVGVNPHKDNFAGSGSRMASPGF